MDLKVPFIDFWVKDLPPIPRIFVFLGLIALVGTLGSPAFLPGGFSLIFLGWTCMCGHGLLWFCHRPGDEYCSDHEYDQKRHLHVGESLVPFMLCLGACVGCAILAGSYLAQGHWPWILPNSHARFEREIDEPGPARAPRLISTNERSSHLGARPNAPPGSRRGTATCVARGLIGGFFIPGRPGLLKPGSLAGRRGRPGQPGRGATLGSSPEQATASS